MDERLKWLALNLVKGISSILAQRLYKAFGSVDAILNAQASELRQIEGIGRELSERISSFNIEDALKRERELMALHGIDFLTFKDKGFPEPLKHIYDPPIVLYIKGTFSLNDNISISIVGSRHPTNYGKTVALNLSTRLAAKGITIVSGMARGIDTMAHRGAIRGNGRTIAVLGSGLDSIYPPENNALAGKIIDNGAIVSEFPMGTQPFKQNFPRRNRIISGLSLGTLVVEAGEKSGALITSRFALEHGREVFAVPGSINSWASKGTNTLIKQGAKLVSDIQDIIDELPLFIQKALSGNQITRENNPQPKTDLVDSNIRSILKSFGDTPLHIDTIIERTGISTNKLYSHLMEMEIKGMIKQLPGNVYTKI